jgi:hypothetical protein
VLLLPVRWSAIRGEFQRRLEDRLRKDLHGVYAAIPADVADALVLERRQVEQLVSETREVATWLEQRQQATSVAALYGNETTD